MTNYKETGKNIVLLRHAQNLTQEKLAFQSNRSVNCIQEVEKGQTNITVDTLFTIAAALDVDPRVLDIFSWKDNEILTEFRRMPQFPRKAGGNFQFCENIVLLRKSNGLTQKELAKSSGMSTAYLREIEHGCANVTMKKLLSIAYAFDLSLMKLHFLSSTEEELMESIRKARSRADIRVNKV